VLHRLTAAEVGGQRQRCDELGEPDTSSLDRCGPSHHLREVSSAVSLLIARAMAMPWRTPAHGRGAHTDGPPGAPTTSYAESIGTNLCRTRLSSLAVATLVALALLGMSSARAEAALVLGIYPGGGVGAVGPQPATKPEDPVQQMAALDALRGGRGRRFVVRLYAADDGTRRSLPRGVLEEISRYSSAGFDVELVLTYRRPGARPQVSVRRYAAFVRRAVRAMRHHRHVVSLQITNEVNLRGAPNASDGAYPGARQALIRGVVAAKDEVRRRRLTHLRVGFSWAYEQGRASRPFWRSLGRAGGRRFARAVDWVGIDIYPGTWGPGLRGANTAGVGIATSPDTWQLRLPGADIAAAVRARMTGALRTLRRSYLPRAGLGRSVALHVAESGYPTGAGRSDAMQAVVADAVVRAAHDVRTAYHVTDFRWFDLRDADSANPSFESQYGLLRDDYTPKPAFATFAALVARYGTAA
jgi:hypothetical protein